MNQITGHEVVEQIRRALRREVGVTLAHPARTWDRTYCGDVAFVVGDWHMEFYNDCNELDYCAAAATPDGRRGDFEAWWDAGQEPVESLTPDEHARFEALLSGAQAHEPAPELAALDSR